MFSVVKFPLQILQNEIGHHLIHMFLLQRIRDAVALRRIEHQIELLSGLLQLVRELQGLLHVDVVVHRAVYQQNPAVEIFGGF